MASLETLPEELVDTIFQMLAQRVPLRWLVSLRLVSKFYDAKIMSPRIFTRLTHEWHINYCQDKNTLMKWLRWSFNHNESRNPQIYHLRRFVDHFLSIVNERSDRQAETYDVETVGEVLLDLVADQIIIYRWKMVHPRVRGHTYNQLLWWRHGWSFEHPATLTTVSMCIASAFGDSELLKSLFETSVPDAYAGTSQFVGLPIYTAIRHGHLRIACDLLAREGHVQLCCGGWTILDQAIFSDRQQSPPTAFLDLDFTSDYHYSRRLAGKPRDKALRDVLVRSLTTAATFRNYMALDMLLSHQGASNYALSVDEQQALLFAACLGEDSGFEMATHIFAMFPTLSPNCCVRSPERFAGSRTSRFMRPLDAAICRGDVHLVQLLLDHGAVADHCGDLGPSVLVQPSVSFEFAARHGFVRCMALLLNAGLGQHYLSEGALVQASISGSLAAVVLILEADVQVCDDNQLNAMANAYFAGTESVVDLLRSRGFDSQAAKDKGELLLIKALSSNRRLYS